MSKSLGLYALTLCTSLLCFAQQNYNTPTRAPSSMHNSTTQPLKKGNIITPNASPVVDGGADLFLAADFIYWTARQAGMTFATLNYIPSNAVATSNQTYTSSKNLYVSNKYSPGFKAGLGLIMDHDGWDMYLEYTWFRTNPKSKTYTASGESVVSPHLEDTFGLTTTAPLTSFTAETATTCAQWKLRFNDFNLELGRNFYVSHYLTLRPHAGLKGGWQKQNYNIYWTYDDVTTTSGFSDVNYTTTLRQKMWDLGLRAGIDTAWMLTKNFSFVGDFALAGVWTQFTVNHVDLATTSGSLVPQENASNFQTINQRAQFHAITPVVELLLGLRFDWSFSDDNYRLRFQAAWENQVWFNQNNFSSTLSSAPLFTTRADQLTLQGLTAEVRFDF